MQNNCWDKIEELFVRALVLEPEQRRQFIEQECGADEELLGEILSLIENHESPDSFLDNSVFSIGLRLLEDETDDLVRKKNFAHYKLLKILGRGGTGTVYLAQDNKLKRPVALKILPGQFSENTESLLRFRREARAASQFSHPNIAYIYEFGKKHGRYFMAMEYVRGTTLRQFITDNRVSPHQAADITRQIGKALLTAHQAGIIHRDIKPENVIVTEDKTIKVLDFGLAKITESADAGKESILDTSLLETASGTVIGTTAYMSPEQVRGFNPDARCDLWSLGVILYEMIAGERPFEGDTKSDVRAAILLNKFEMPPAAARYPHLEIILRKSLSKETAGRYTDAAAMLDDLHAFLEELDNDKTQQDLRKRRLPVKIYTGGVFAGFQPLFRQPLLKTFIFGVIFSLLLLTGVFLVNRQTPAEAADSLSLEKTKSVFNHANFAHPVISPDGRQIAYTYEENGGQAIYLLNINSSKTAPTKLLAAPENLRIGKIAFAPDGKNLYFSAHSAGEPFKTLYKIPANGETVKPETVLNNIENMSRN